MVGVGEEKMGSIIKILILILSINSHARNVGRFEGVEYVAEGQVHVFWKPVAKATYYEVDAIWSHPTSAAYDITYSYPVTTTTEIYLDQKRAGFFVFRVRGCSSVRCSSWSYSTDPTKAVVDNVPKAWRTFWVLPRPVVTIE